MRLGDCWPLLGLKKFGARKLFLILIFGVKTVDFWCEKVTFILVLVRICYFIWCENVIFAFRKCGAKKLTFGAKSRARPTLKLPRVAQRSLERL